MKHSNEHTEKFLYYCCIWEFDLEDLKGGVAWGFWEMGGTLNILKGRGLSISINSHWFKPNLKEFMEKKAKLKAQTEFCLIKSVIKLLNVKDMTKIKQNPIFRWNCLPSTPRLSIRIYNNIVVCLKGF